ncbi:MAG: hypothetical protein E7379_03610 [Clostridiales bacterium]|nr:hypothetical protein [Clostridiales bacterium]
MKLMDFLKKQEESDIQFEEDVIDVLRKEMLEQTYNRAYLFYGEREKREVVDGDNITYLHSECFLSDNKYPIAIQNFIRLTGENINGEKLRVKRAHVCGVGKQKSTIFYVEDNGVEYSISYKDCLDENWLKDHYLSGAEIIQANDRYNFFKKKQQLEKIAKQKQMKKQAEKDCEALGQK